jgi:L-fuculose-phosphate aldolase
LPALEGNLSARLSDDSVLITPSGRPKYLLETDELIRLPEDGWREWISSATGGQNVPSGPRPSSEFSMHACTYHRHVEVGAVVHAHPPVATGTAAWPEPPAWNELPEVRVVVRGVTVVPALEPGTVELGRAVAEAFGRGGAVLLARHGATTVGGTVEEAVARMESLEQAARLLLVEALGSVVARGTARLG